MQKRKNDYRKSARPADYAKTGRKVGHSKVDPNKVDQDWLLIANSTPLSKSKLLKLATNRHIMVLDGAYEHITYLNVQIDVLLGDFDSIPPELMEEAHKAVEKVIRAPDQNQTDLEKGIHYLDKLGAKNIVICAATGKRLQHTIYNLRMMKKFYREDRALRIVSEHETILYVQNAQIEITGKMGDSIGVLGFPQAKITSSGLKYEMKNYSLEFELHASVCNELVKEHASIAVDGAALVIQEHG